MAKGFYARRYAQAVFELALASNQLERWQSDLGKVAGVLGDTTLIAWLENPKIHFDEKLRVLAENLNDISPLALNLVRLLVAKGKPALITEVATEYQRRLDQHNGIERAEVITAVPLDDKTELELAAKLGTITGKKVVLKPRVDPAVLGGVIARIGGKLLDASTRSKLEALRKEIAGRGVASAGKEAA